MSVECRHANNTATRVTYRTVGAGAPLPTDITFGPGHVQLVAGSGRGVTPPPDDATTVVAVKPVPMPDRPLHPLASVTNTDADAAPPSTADQTTTNGVAVRQDENSTGAAVSFPRYTVTTSTPHARSTVKFSPTYHVSLSRHGCSTANAPHMRTHTPVTHTGSTPARMALPS